MQWPDRHRQTLPFIILDACAELAKPEDPSRSNNRQVSPNESNSDLENVSKIIKTSNLRFEWISIVFNSIKACIYQLIFICALHILILT